MAERRLSGPEAAALYSRLLSEKTEPRKISADSIEAAIGNARLSGVFPSHDALVLLGRMRLGEITADEAVAILAEKYREDDSS